MLYPPLHPHHTHTHTHHHPVVYSTDRSKAVVPMLALLFVALWFILRGDFFKMPQSQTAALPRHQGEEETDKPNKHKSNKRTKSTKISYFFPKRGNRNAKRTDQHKNKIKQGKT